MQNLKRAIGRLDQIVDTLPITVPLFIASLGISGVFFLLLEKFSVVNVGLFGLAAFVISLISLRKIFKIEFDTGKSRERTLSNWLLVVGIGVWILFNSLFVSQSVFMTRDPALYTASAKLLTSNSTTNVKVVDLGLSQSLIRNESNGMWQDLSGPSRTNLQPQGMHLLPVLLAFFSRLFSSNLIYVLNVVFGGAALFAVYGFSRTLLRPYYALFATGLLSLTLPFIYFSRDTYTEPLAALFTFGGLALLTIAERRKHLPTWGWAGVLVGGSVLVRPDAYLTIIAMVIYIGLRILLTNKKERGGLVKGAAIWSIVTFAVASLGWLDITIMSKVYYHGQGEEIKLQLLLLGVVLVALSIIHAVNVFYKDKITTVLNRFIKNKAAFFAILFIGIFLLLSLRPLVFKDMAGPSNGVGATINAQIRLGEPPQPRTYAESTVQWLNWYMGEIMVALAIFGMALVIYLSLKKNRHMDLLGILVIATSAMLYLIRPSITPDHIWAARRFLPVIIPGFIIYGTHMLDVLTIKAEKSGYLKTNNQKAVLALILSFIVVTPVLVTRPFIRVSEKPDHEAAVLQYCEKLNDKDLVVWMGSLLELDTVQTTRAYCGNPSIGYDFEKSGVFEADKSFDQKELKQIHDAITKAGFSPVIAIKEKYTDVFTPEQKAIFTTASSYRTNGYQQSLSNPPRYYSGDIDSIMVARISPDGSLVGFNMDSKE